MKYVDEYRDGKLAHKIAEDIRNLVKPELDYYFMEFCGGHTHAIFRYGIPDLLPENVHLVHGPGCPVCVLPIERIDAAIELAVRHNVILCAYGDMMRVPGSNRASLLKIKAEGADVRMVYSCNDVLMIAQDNPDSEVVFFAIGFETTTPPTAIMILQANNMALKNLSVFCNHVLTPSAIGTILESPEIREMGTLKLDGFIGPAHVSTIIGSQPYEYFAEEFQKPVVIAGFEPLDVLQALVMLIKQVNEGRAEVENEFVRAVTADGNIKAKKLVSEIFELRPEFSWRGLGNVPYSGLRIKQKYRHLDAEYRFVIAPSTGKENKACECPSILRGVKKPQDCKLFGKACTPEMPLGSCMVSSEGACAAYYSYGRFRMA